MKKIVLRVGDIYKGNLILVNASHPILSVMVDDLVPADPRYPDVCLKRDAANVLQLIEEKISSGSAIVPVSGYRSNAEQTDIYQNSLKENGAEFTKKYVALPKCSEHQTGLAIDLALNKPDIDFICPDFPYDGICQEFRKAAFEYGFIERYPQDKAHITGICHEPWHFRYVGYPHSKIMAGYDLTLEEYIDFVRQYDISERLVFSGKCGSAEVFFVPSAGEMTAIEFYESDVFQVSGNNVDGFIVTVWRKE